MAPLILNFGSIVVSGQLPALAPVIHWIWGWVSLRAGPGVVWRYILTQYKTAASFQASSVKLMRNAFLWTISQWVMAIPYRRFGTTYRPTFKGQDQILDSWRRNQIVCTETSARNLHYLLCNSPEERSPEDWGEFSRGDKFLVPLPGIEPRFHGRPAHMALHYSITVLPIHYAYLF